MAKGNTISLMDGLYSYELPPEPADEKQIMNYDLKKADQVWRRPEIRDVKRMTVRERGEYIEKMDDYFYNGMWMFIDGELIWISGMHWDFLQMSKWEFGYAQYLEQQRFDFYFRDLVRKDPYCYGKAILKCRRCGITTEELEEAIYTLIEDEGHKIALQSTDHPKCIQSLLRPIIDSYMERPHWMRGRFYAPNGKKPRNALELVNNKVDVLNDVPDSYLKGTIMAYPTVAHAVDTYKKKLIIMDEAFKWTEASIEETLGVNKKCVVEYGIKGKVDVLSTMGDSDDVAQSVKEGCKIVYDSNPKIRDSNGRTTSGLYEWFISAIHSADIPEEHRDPAYTKFGKINKDSAEAYVKGEVNKHPANSKQRIFEMRRLPLIRKHGLLAATSKDYLPALRMQDRLDALNLLPRDQKPYVRGNFSMPDMKGRISFEPDESGIWLISVHPYFSAEKNIDTRNRWRSSVNGQYLKAANPEFVIGYDPIKFKKKNTTSKNLSLACLVVWKKFDYFGSGVSNEYCALMLHRPDDPKDAHFEAVKACRYYGAPIKVERNVGDTDDVFVENGMEDFLLTDKHGIFGMHTTDKTTENGVQRLATKFAAPKTEEDKDQVDCYPFEDGLLDFINFDISNSQNSHVTMATVMCEYGADQLVFTNTTDNSVQRMLKAAQSVFPPINR
jgi:hypothetical protein